MAPPTLDVKIIVEEGNQVSISYYEKPTVTNVMVQRRSAMEENSKVQILANDMVRRLANTDPRQSKEEHCKVVDMFTQRLLTNGYIQDQARRIILSGLRGWERRKAWARNEGRRVYRTSKQSAPGRKYWGNLLSSEKDCKEDKVDIRKTDRRKGKYKEQTTPNMVD